MRSQTESGNEGNFKLDNRAVRFMGHDDKADRDLAVALESLQGLFGLLFHPAGRKFCFREGF